MGDAMMRHLRTLAAVSLMLVTALIAAADFDYGLSPRQVAEDTWVVVGRNEDFSFENGGNIVNSAFIVTSEGVVVIDSGPSRRFGEQLRAAIARITDQPILRVLNTHHHPDHFLGNQAFPLPALRRWPARSRVSAAMANPSTRTCTASPATGCSAPR